MVSNPDDWLTVQDVARILDVSIATIRRWIRAGDLPVLELGGSRVVYRIRREDLETFVRENHPEMVVPDWESPGEPSRDGSDASGFDDSTPPIDLIDLPEIDNEVAVAEISQQFVDRIPVVTFREHANSAGHASYISHEIEALLGYSPDYLSRDADQWRQLIHPSDRQRVEDEYARTDATGEPFDMEYRMIGRDGRSVWVRVQAELVSRENGEVPVWEGTISDVSERRMLEEDLRLRVLQHEALATMSNLALESGTSTSLYEELVIQVTLAFDVEVARAYEVIPGGTRLQPCAVSDVRDNGARAHTGLIEDDTIDPLAALCVARRNVISSGDLVNDERFREYPAFVDTNLRSGIAAVIPGRVRPAGVVSVFSRESDRFAPDDVRFLQAMARIVSKSPALHDGRWLTVNEVAEALQVTEETVRRWIRQAELPALNLGGHRAGYRVYPSDLERFIQDRLL